MNLGTAINILANNELDMSPAIEWLLSTLTPIIGFIVVGIAICILCYLLIFWFGYFLADDEARQEKMVIWKKQWIPIVIAIAICATAGGILSALGTMMGVPISLG